MNHKADGTLQAYLDGELDGPAAAELTSHVAACAACARELDELRVLNTHAAAAFAVLPDVTAPMLRARAALAAERSARPRRVLVITTGALAKAAMLLLVLAGASAALPGSPVRLAVESVLDRVAQLIRRDVPEVAAPAMNEPVVTPAVETLSSWVTPVNGRVRIQLHPANGPIDVTVRLTDARRARVDMTSTQTGARQVSGSGRFELRDIGPGSVLVELPYDAIAATIEVDGVVNVYKQNGLLKLGGPAGRAQGSEVTFTIRP